MSTPALELKGIRAAYGRIEVLHGVDLVVPEGSVMALLGPNGGGKTTTLKVASGQMPPLAGCVHIGGRHVNGASPDSLARIGVCTIPEGRGVFPNLTVRENLRMVTYAGAPMDQVEERAYTTFPRLKERRTQLAGTMSGGEQQMLAMARGLAVDPAILFLDEATEGLAPLVRAEIWAVLDKLKQSGLSLIVIDKNIGPLLRLADRHFIVEKGRVVWSGDSATLSGQPELLHRYLGV